MPYKFTIAQPKLKKEDGVPKSLTVTVLCNKHDAGDNFLAKSRLETTIEASDLTQPTLKEAKKYLKEHMTEVLNQSEIDEAIEKQKEDDTVIIPEEETRVKHLKEKVDGFTELKPEITEEEIEVKDKNLTIS